MRVLLYKRLETFELVLKREMSKTLQDTILKLEKTDFIFVEEVPIDKKWLKQLERKEKEVKTRAIDGCEVKEGRTCGHGYPLFVEFESQLLNWYIQYFKKGLCTVCYKQNKISRSKSNKCDNCLRMEQGLEQYLRSPNGQAFVIKRLKEIELGNGWKYRVTKIKRAEIEPN